MLFITVCSFIVTQTVGQGIVPSNTPDGHGLMFQTSDRGLPWPITQPNDLNAVIAHGAHCLRMVAHLSSSKIDNALDQFHLDHCVNLLQETLKIYEENNKDIQVPPGVCTDIKENFPNFDFDPTQDWSLCYCLKYSFFINTKSVHTPQTVFKAVQNDTSNQNELMGAVMGQNFGTILMKEHLRKEVTSEEKTFLAAWKTPRVNRFAALGLSCIHGNGQPPVELIKYILNLQKMTMI